MGPDQQRLSRQGLRVLSVIMETPTATWYGLELAARAGLRSGTIYPLLARFERFGWLSSGWEEISASEAKRPRRRLYHLTGEGERAAARHLAEARAELRPVGPQIRPGWGDQTA